MGALAQGKGRCEQVCACKEPEVAGRLDEEDVAVEVRACGEFMPIPIDTAALSVWVDEGWYREGGGKLLPKGGSAQAADGHGITVVGTGQLEFRVWGETFKEPVRIMCTLPDKILLGRRFWQQRGLKLDLEERTASIRPYDGSRLEGGLCSRVKSGENDEKWNEAVSAVIGDSDLDQALKTMDLREFSPNPSKRNKLRSLLWKRRGIFKGLGKIRGETHRINLKPGAMPVCEPGRRRSPKEEELERSSMEKLLRMGVLEPATSPWAANNVFVRKKDGGTRITSDFRRLNDLMITDSYPMEGVRDVLDWLAKNGCSVFST